MVYCALRVSCVLYCVLRVFCSVYVLCIAMICTRYLVCFNPRVLQGVCVGSPGLDLVWLALRLLVSYGSFPYGLLVQTERR